jgi:hypothetical protein
MIPHSFLLCKNNKSTKETTKKLETKKQIIIKEHQYKDEITS